MKLTATRSALVQALVPAVSVTSRRSSHPFGACVLVTATGGQCEIRSAASIASVRSTILASVERSGTVTVPAEDLLDRIKAMPDGPISISVAKDRLSLRAGSQHYTMRTVASDGFPAHPAPISDPQTVSGKGLASVLTATGHAMGDDVGKARFMGVVLVASGESLTATSCNGTSRFARASCNVDGAAFSTFLPEIAIKALLSTPANDVQFAVSERAVSTRIESDVATVELGYMVPDVGALPYDLMFSKFGAVTGVTVPRRALVTSLHAVTPDGMAGSVPVMLRYKSDSLHLSQTNAEGEESTDEIELSSGTAPEWEAMVEAKFLVEAVQGLGGDDVVLCASTEATHPIFVVRGDAGAALIGQIDRAKRAEASAVKVAA